MFFPGSQYQKVNKSRLHEKKIDNLKYEISRLRNITKKTNVNSMLDSKNYM